VENLGPDTPIHFLRFHPDYQLLDVPPTPVEVLEKHAAIAKEEGLRYVYIGNVPGHNLEHTYCPQCGTPVIKRIGFDIVDIRLTEDNRCRNCGAKINIVGRVWPTYRMSRFVYIPLEAISSFIHVPKEKVRDYIEGRYVAG